MAGDHAPRGAKLAAKRFLRRVGLEAGKPGGRIMQSRIRRIVVPHGFDIEDVRCGRPLTIDIRRITTSYGFSYSDDGWHPHWATLQALLDEPRLHTMASPLARYFERYQPATVQEALFPGEAAPLAPLDRLHPRYVPVVWTLAPRGLRQALAASSGGDHGHSHMCYGPAPEAFVQREFERLRGLLKRIQAEGYRPDDHPDGYVEGYFLISGDDYRFVPTEGQHRLAALRVLGVTTVRAVPRLSLSAVRSDDLDRWTTARGGIYEPEVARRLFDRLWSSRGAEHRDAYSLR